jgi:hypothetical protein
MAKTSTGLLEVYIRISERERDFLKELAKSQSQALGDWLRDAIGCKLERDGLDGSIFFASDVSDGE